MEYVKIDFSSIGQADTQEKHERQAPAWLTLPGVDPRVRAIYEIPEVVFIPEAARALAQFHVVASEYLTQLRDTAGRTSEVSENWPT